MLLAALTGCAGRSTPPPVELKPPESESQTNWRPTAAEPNHLALARDLMGQGHHSVAIRQLTQAAEADPTSPEPQYLLGVCQREIGDMTAARSHFRRAIDLDRDHAPAYNELGIIYFMDNDYLAARKAMQAAVALNPANPDFINNLGVLEMRTNHPREALQRFEECLRIAPDHVQAKNNMAECLVRLGRDNVALAFLQQHFSPAAAYNNLGAIYQQVGYRSHARSMFLRALRIDPDLAEARRNFNRLEMKETPQP
jgi:Tfp pilus assembly protein PilF